MQVVQLQNVLSNSSLSIIILKAVAIIVTAFFITFNESNNKIQSLKILKQSSLNTNQNYYLVK